MKMNSGADLEGAHPAHASCSPLYARPKNKFAPPPPVQPNNLYCCAPGFNIFWIRAWNLKEYQKEPISKSLLSLLIAKITKLLKRI